MRIETFWQADQDVAQDFQAGFILAHNFRQLQEYWSSVVPGLCSRHYELRLGKPKIGCQPPLEHFLRPIFDTI